MLPVRMFHVGFIYLFFYTSDENNVNYNLHTRSAGFRDYGKCLQTKVKSSVVLLMSPQRSRKPLQENIIHCVTQPMLSEWMKAANLQSNVNTPQNSLIYFLIDK